MSFEKSSNKFIELRLYLKAKSRFRKLLFKEV